MACPSPLQIYSAALGGGSCCPGDYPHWTGATPGTGALMCNRRDVGPPPVPQTISHPENCVGNICARVFTKEETDAAGRRTLTVSRPSGGALDVIGQVCLQNCGSGMGFFGLGGGAAEIARTVGTVISKIAPALTGYGAAYSAAELLSTSVERSQKGMGLNLGGILSSVGGIIGGANFGSYDWLGNLGGAGLQIAGAALTPTPAPTMIAGPMYGPPAQVYQPQPIVQAQPVMSAAPAFAVAGRAIAAVTAPILAKIAVKLGLRARPSLNRAMEMVRKAAKLLQSPEAVAVALGITVTELATLITSSNARKRRRMNPANSKALRRAARRIKSFHRLCTHTDVLRNRGPRRSVGRSCGTCKSKPCRC